MKKSFILKLFTMVAVLSVFSNYAVADCDNTGNPIQISGSCEDLNINGVVTGVTIDAAATVSAFFSPSAVTIGTSGNVTDTFQNMGTINNGIYHNGMVSNGAIQTLLNTGTISSTSHNGLANSGTIGTLTNSGTITSNSDSHNYAALVNSIQIGTLNNTGTISATAGSYSQGAYAIEQDGHIGTLNNSGTITAHDRAINFQQGFTSRIDTLINSGTIEGGINGGGKFASAIVLGGGNSIGTIINTGTIDHSVCSGGDCYAAIENRGGSIDTITNLGKLTSGNTNSDGFGIINSTSGTIGTLNNDQGNLKYYGNLPQNYNAIIYGPSNYGKLDVTNPSGSMKVDVYAAAPIGTTVYTALISGVTAANLANTTGSYGGGGLAQTSWKLANTGGGTVWDLMTDNTVNANPTVSSSSAGTKLAKAMSGALTKFGPVTTDGPTITYSTSAPTPTPVVVPTTVTTQVVTSVSTPTTTAQPTTTTQTTYTTTTTPTGSITTTPVVTTTTAPTVQPVAAPTTAVTTTTSTTQVPTTVSEPTTTVVVKSDAITVTPVSPKLVNGTDYVLAAQALTTGQVNQLSNVHAEGYSSNLTIGLQQMGQISEAVMDRIHSPMSSRSGGASSAYEVDQGRYVWLDGSASHGNVNSYDSLAGFSYNLYNMILGTDIFRDSGGGLGAYAGVGYSNMSESAQVSQNFNTTNYFAGLYGGKYLPWNVKLSGSLGYVYGQNNASRNNISVGQFTGGTANSNFGTNGVYGAFKLSKPMLANDTITLTPFVGASYSQLWMNQASESGGGDFSYNISNGTAYTTVTFVGGEFVMPLTGAVKNPMSLIGFYKFGYDWFANSAYAHSVTASNSVFGSFNQIGADMGPVLNIMGLGIQGNIVKGLSGRIGAVGSANSNGWQVGGGGELKWEL